VGDTNNFSPSSRGGASGGVVEQPVRYLPPAAMNAWTYVGSKRSSRPAPAPASRSRRPACP
jgi:hypothetical protein